MSTAWPVIVLGGSGYVAGEMLRLIASHPRLSLGAAVSTSLVGKPIAASFPHLAPAYARETFVSGDEVPSLLSAARHWILLSAAPHGASAQLVRIIVDEAARCGVQLTVVDASADFRFRDAAAFSEIYGSTHAAPELLPRFICAVPEHVSEVQTPHAAHPGCFATTMLLGIVPLLSAGVCEPTFSVSAVTGSTGAGRTPRETTHHPVRQSNLFAYQVLKHRHSPEVIEIAELITGREPKLHFVPHSGPFARGIHATIFAPIRPGVTRADVQTLLYDYYADSKFVSVAADPPRMKDIAGSNFAVLSADIDEEMVVVCSVLDNLVKGAAGGSIQWVNRLLDLPDDMGLAHPAAGWT